MSDRKAPAAVLSSKVYNEAELIFHLLEHKDRRCVSALDTVTLMRGMGMNPVQAEIDALQREMAPLVAELDELRYEEERKKEALKKKEEQGKGGKDASKKDTKDAKGKDAKGKDATGKDAKPGEAGKEGEGGEGADGEGKEGKKRVLTDPIEEVKNIDWHIFITSVEPHYKDLATERDEIIKALQCFDPERKGRITMNDLIKIVTTNGESVLSPADVKQFREVFQMESMDFAEFADRINGTYQPPPPPTAEELARMEEERKAEQERIRKEQQANDFDSLLGGGSLAGPPTAVPSAPAAESTEPPASASPEGAESSA
jgi:regulator of replication initiation timing